MQNIGNNVDYIKIDSRNWDSLVRFYILFSEHVASKLLGTSLTSLIYMAMRVALSLFFLKLATAILNSHVFDQAENRKLNS